MTVFIPPLPNTFSDGATMSAIQVQANFDWIAKYANLNITPVASPIIGAFPFYLISGEIADANKVQANFDFIVTQVNARAAGIASPIISALPFTLRNGTTRDAARVNANFSHIVSQININGALVQGSFVITDPLSLKTAITTNNGVVWAQGGTLPTVSSGQPPGSNILWAGTFYCVTGGRLGFCISPDALSWVQAGQISNAVNSDLASGAGAAYNGSKIASLWGDFAANMIYSTNGLNWSFATGGIASTCDMAWNGSVFCAARPVTPQASTSPDGITWTARTLPASAPWSGIAWNGTVFCLVSGDCSVISGGSANSTAAATSPNGITWTARTLPASRQWSAIAWNGTVFCAISGNGSNTAATSPDGITWTLRTLPASLNWRRIKWNGSVFCAMPRAGSVVATSPDGITWTSRTLPFSLIDASGLATSFLTFGSY